MRVPLNNTDNISALQAADIEILQKEDITSKELRKSFRLPCAALENNCCQIYDDRPTNCRKFRCDLLKRFERGEVLHSDAQQKIAYVQQLREKLKDELSKNLPEYKDVSIPVLYKKAPTREEMIADPVLFKKWKNVLMYLAALRDRIQSDFHPALQKF